MSGLSTLHMHFADGPDAEHMRRGGRTRSLVLIGLVHWQRGALRAALEEAGALWILPEVLAHHGFGVELEGSALVHPEARPLGAAVELEGSALC